MADFDDVDRTIVDQLSRDSHQGVVSLSRRVGLSRATHARLRRLEASNVIAQYTIRLASPHEEGGVKAVLLLVLDSKSPHQRMIWHGVWSKN